MAKKDHNYKEIAGKIVRLWDLSIKCNKGEMGQAEPDEFDRYVEELTKIGLVSFKPKLGRHHLCDTITKSPAIMAGGFNRELIFHDIELANEVRSVLAEKHNQKTLGIYMHIG